MKQKRLGALLLTLCMTIGLLPGVVIPASAAAAPIYWGVTAGNELILSSAEADTAACTDKGSFPSDSCSFSLGNGSVDLDAIPWETHRRTITKVTVKDTVAPIGSVSYLFYKLMRCTTMDLGGLDTSNVTDMRGMFHYCEALTSLDLSGFDTANVTDMLRMFCHCEALTSLDLSGFNTANVTNMQEMFMFCYALADLDVSNFNTSNVTSMLSMFMYCYALTDLDVSNFNTSNVTNMDQMFGYCKALTTLDVSNFDTSKVTDMSHMFGNCETLTTLDLSNFNTSNVTSMDDMFYECEALTDLDISNFDTSEVTDMWEMFRYCKALTDLDLSSFDVSKVTSTNRMLSDLEGLKTLTISDSVAALMGKEDIGMTDLYTCRAAYPRDGYGRIAGLRAGTYATSSAYPAHTLSKTEATATCETSGAAAYWTCSACNKMFSDKNGGTQITVVPTIPATGHSWGKWTLQEDDETLKRVCGNDSTHTESKTLNVIVASGPFIYNGTAQEPTVTLTADSVSLTLNTDYAVAYADNVDVGTGKITITGKGDYAFSLEREFAIAKAKVDDSALIPGSLNIANKLEKEYVYTLTHLCPTITEDWGERSYAIEKVEFTETGYYTDNTARIDKAEGGTYANRLYLPILSNDTTTTGWVGTVTIRLSSSNYEDYTNTVKIMSTNKTAVTFQGDPTNNKVYDSQPYVLAMEKLTVWDGMEDVTGKAMVEVTYTGRGTTSYSPKDPHTPPTDAGEYAVTIRVVDADPKYIGHTSYNLVISQAPGGGSVTMANYTEGQTPSQPVPISTTNGIENVSYQYKVKDASDETYAAVQPTVAGTYTVRATFPAVRNYTEAVATADFTVLKATQPTAPKPQPSSSDDDDDDDIYYPLTATAEKGGSIDPSGKVSVRWNGKKTFAIAPAEGYAIADVLVDGKSVGAVSSYTFEKVVKPHTIEASFEAVDAVPYVDCPRDNTCPIHPFIDAKTTAWYHDGVHYCLENGLMVGISGKTFAPDTNISRAMVVMILWRLAGSPTTDTASNFDDVPSDAWYAGAVAWAVSADIVKGHKNGGFSPNDPITREQLATMLYRYEQKINGGGFTGSWMFRLDFTDADQVSAWADEAMHYMTMHGIIQGEAQKLLAPKGQATRAQTAAILQRFCESTGK